MEWQFYVFKLKCPFPCFFFIYLDHTKMYYKEVKNNRIPSFDHILNQQLSSCMRERDPCYEEQNIDLCLELMGEFWSSCHNPLKENNNVKIMWKIIMDNAKRSMTQVTQLCMSQGKVEQMYTCIKSMCEHIILLDTVNYWTHYFAWYM